MVATPAVVRLHANRATFFGDTVRLLFDAPAPANDTVDELPAAERTPCPEYKWIHAANTGVFKGHHQGEFQITPATFAELIRNFRGDPKYGVGEVELSTGPVECGAQPVVQFDYEHASEMAPWEGSIPTSGAPACGWVLELETRPDPDGDGAQLWVLGKLGQQIRGQIDRDEYGSVSIAWNPKGIHWVTGEPIGAVLTSVAFTNHPFIRDLEPLAAANRAAGHNSRSELQPRAQSTEAHGDGHPPPIGDPMTAPLTAELRTRLCAIYRLNPAADDGSVIRAAENASSAGNDLAGLLKALGVGDPAAALATVPDLMAARSKLQDLLTQFDALLRGDAAADAEVAEQDVAAAMSSRRYTDPSVVPALAAHRLSAIQTEISKLPADKQRDVGETRLARSRGRLAFLQHYGVNLNPAQQHLSQTFVAGPGVAGNSVQYAPPLPAPMSLATFGGPVQYPAPPQYGVPRPGQPLQLSQQLPAPTVDLSQYSGRNVTEQIIAYLSSVDVGFSKLPHGQQIQRASQWRKQHEQAAA